MIWDGGWPEQPEDETEQAWQDPLDGEVPGKPEGEWDEYLSGPEYWLWKKKRKEEEGE